MVANGHKPNFVPAHVVSRRRLRVTIIHLGPPSPTASSALPAPNPADHGREAACTASGGLLGFARGGVCRAPIVTNRAVRSYRTISPLPVPDKSGHRPYVFCGTFPDPATGGRWALPTTMSYRVRTFLDPDKIGIAIVCPRQV